MKTREKVKIAYRHTKIHCLSCQQEEEREALSCQAPKKISSENFSHARRIAKVAKQIEKLFLTRNILYFFSIQNNHF